MKKQNAFTLAEVLITLTIIGVIAAITIPNLMQNYRKHERITQIKSAYSIIQNAVKMSIAENGNTDGWAYNESFDFAEKYIVPYLKIAKKCGTGTYNYYGKGCFDDNDKNGSWKYLDGEYNDGNGGYGPNFYYNVKLQNGMSLGIWAAASNLFQYGYYLVLFVFDVNGSKGPTQAGNDVFAFVMDTRVGIVYTMSRGHGNNGITIVSKETNINTLLNYTEPYSCNISAIRSGLGCTRILELNHWEFPDNYPIKKF